MQLPAHNLYGGCTELARSMYGACTECAPTGGLWPSADSWGVGYGKLCLRSSGSTLIILCTGDHQESVAYIAGNESGCNGSSVATSRDNPPVCGVPGYLVTIGCPGQGKFRSRPHDRRQTIMHKSVLFQHPGPGPGPGQGPGPCPGPGLDQVQVQAQAQVQVQVQAQAQAQVQVQVQAQTQTQLGQQAWLAEWGTLPSGAVILSEDESSVQIVLCRAVS